MQECNLLDEIRAFQLRLTTNDDESVKNNLPHNVVFDDLKILNNSRNDLRI